MFRIKICGITRVEDAVAAADAGADAIGINFYSGSPRFCPPELASGIASATPKHVFKVGVFVNSTAEQIRDIVRSVGLDLVQLHGDEPPEMIAELGGPGVMRAFRVGADLSQVTAYLDRCRQLAAIPRMVLVDAFDPNQYGGTGQTIDGSILLKDREQLGGLPLVLAGGLTPLNVAAAITAVRPQAVDVASGVETRPGEKSAPLVHQFVAAARAAFAQLEPGGG